MKSGVEIVALLDQRFPNLIRNEHARQYLIELIEMALDNAYTEGQNKAIEMTRKKTT